VVESLLVLIQTVKRMYISCPLAELKVVTVPGVVRHGKTPRDGSAH
jgi:hypothetical protein